MQNDHTPRPLDDDSVFFPTIVGPFNAPTMCTPDLIGYIAAMVRDGASITGAAMACAIAPSRLRDWLKWGEQSYRAGNQGQTYDHAYDVYLALYTQILQALGRARVSAEMEVFATAKGGWLSRSPDTRGDWGGDVEHAVLPEAPPVIVESSAAPPAISIPDMRGVLKALIESGVALPIDAANAGGSPVPFPKGAPDSLDDPAGGTEHTG
jgi:hypothetical protein